jgi:hypothetical protein
MCYWQLDSPRCRNTSRRPMRTYSERREHSSSIALPMRISRAIAHAGNVEAIKVECYGDPMRGHVVHAPQRIGSRMERCADTDGAGAGATVAGKGKGLRDRS